MMGHTAKYVPTHPHLFTVEFGVGAFAAYLKAAKSFEPGDTVVAITGARGNTKAYHTLQCGGSDEHLILDSDLQYANHSCEPNTVWDMSSSDAAKWHVRVVKHIAKGDKITFFYPSTEWEMDQPFKCNCGAITCLGVIRGAKHLNPDVLLGRGFVNLGILRMIEAHSESRSKSMSKL